LSILICGPATEDIDLDRLEVEEFDQFVHSRLHPNMLPRVEPGSCVVASLRLWSMNLGRGAGSAMAGSTRFCCPPDAAGCGYAESI
jgi:hypothetical protein